MTLKIIGACVAWQYLTLNLPHQGHYVWFNNFFFSKEEDYVVPSHTSLLCFWTFEMLLQFMEKNCVDTLHNITCGVPQWNLNLEKGEGELFLI